MAPKLPHVLRHFRGRNIIIAATIGIAVLLFMVFKDFDLATLEAIEWGANAWFWVTMSIIMMVLRDLFYIVRLRILSDNEISWRNSFQVMMLWEFASAVTPSAIGGTGVALFIVAQEKLNSGKTTAIVLLTSLLDEIFFITMVPLIFLVIGIDTAFPEIAEGTLKTFFSGSIYVIFSVGYLILFSYTIFLLIGIFYKPQLIRRLMFLATYLKFLGKWRRKAVQLGIDIETASIEFKTKPFRYWLKAYGATFIAWTARYIMVNCLIMAFYNLDEHLIVYGRQLVMWVILLIAPTPGGSGIAESLFPIFFGDYLPQEGLPIIVAGLWRLLSYYPYIIIGAIVLPVWLRRVFSK